jgi:hypothetical protein
MKLPRNINIVMFNKMWYTILYSIVFSTARPRCRHYDFGIIERETQLIMGFPFFIFNL